MNGVKNSSFTEVYCPETSTPTSSGGPFSPSTYYTVYVRGTNACYTSGGGPYTEFPSDKTPVKPGGCEEVRESPIKYTDNTQSGDVTDYKVYPNPANNRLIIEYPAIRIILHQPFQFMICLDIKYQVGIYQLLKIV